MCTKRIYQRSKYGVQLFARNAAANINHYNKTVGTHIQRLDFCINGSGLEAIVTYESKVQALEAL